MHIVLINGPAGAGKNTLAERIKAQLFTRAAAANIKLERIGIEEHKQPLIDMLYAFAESLSAVQYNETRTAELYERLKDTKLLGHTGRQWQITWANAMRGMNPNVFTDFLHTKARNMKLDVLISPDCGFYNEYQEGHRRAGGTANLTMIYLDGWKPNVAQYVHGESFHNDNRMCLRDLAMLENPSGSDAASYIFDKIAMAHAQSSLTF